MDRRFRFPIDKFVFLEPHVRQVARNELLPAQTHYYRDPARPYALSQISSNSGDSSLVTTISSSITMDSNEIVFEQRNRKIKDSIAWLVKRFELIQDSIRYYCSKPVVVQETGSDTSFRLVASAAARDSYKHTERMPDSTVKRKKKSYQRLLDNPNRSSGSGSIYSAPCSKEGLDAEMKALMLQVAALQVQLSNNNRSTVKSANGSAHGSQSVVSAGKTGSADMDSFERNDLANKVEELNHRVDSLKATMADSVSKVEDAMAVANISNYPIVSVYFTDRQAWLGQDQIARIRPLVEVALRNNKVNVLLRAYTDGVGSREANMIIGFRRTEYVRTILTTQFRIPNSRVVSEESVLYSGNYVKRWDPLLRRVELSLTL